MTVDSSGGCVDVRVVASSPVLVVVAALCSLSLGCDGSEAAGPVVDSVLLVTLDTTRADELGCYGGSAETPHLDALAARGLRWERAITPVPLTLPAHASLLTGLAPPEHGVRDNGMARLPDGIPTLAEAFRQAGFATGAFVGSRVLDRRFGLDRGFDRYDDTMAAEDRGEYGYPERRADAVADAALAWWSTRAAEPRFLWVHFYDPHAPYDAPDGDPAADLRSRYRDEIHWTDRQVGRLLDALPPNALVAVVGDHGEMLGEHGERGHGFFLYRSSLEVPLILAGPGVPSGATAVGPVATSRLGSTLLRLTGLAPTLGPTLPEPAGPHPPVYSETRLPATAHGWSPLGALSEGRYKMIVAPRPELYDLVADPAEAHDLASADRATLRHLRARWEEVEAGFVPRTAPGIVPDAALEAELESLGYLSGAEGPARGDGLDPKDGILLFQRYEEARSRHRSGDPAGAAAELTQLVAASPANVPFRTALAAALLDRGNPEGAVTELRRAVALNPRRETLHLQLATALRRAGRAAEARAECEAARSIDGRSAGAWACLAELAAREGAAAERKTLRAAVAADVGSATLLCRLAQLELERGALAEAREAADRAFDISPRLGLVWWTRGLVTEGEGRPEAALEELERAAELDPLDPRRALDLGRRLVAAGRSDAARPHLEGALDGPVEIAAAARQLLERP